MKYPIDAATAEAFFAHLIAHQRAQHGMIQALTILLQQALANPIDARQDGPDDEDYPEWVGEAKRLFKIMEQHKLDHDNRIFNEKNGKAVGVMPTAANPIPNSTPLTLNDQGIVDPEENARLNDVEKTFGEEMTEEELNSYFKEKPKKKKKGEVDMSAKDPFKGMTLNEIEAWEAKQDNSNDLFKVKARVMNLARGSGAQVTGMGEALVNMYVHVIKDLYDFAETIPDKELKIRLTERIRKHEGMPASIIAFNLSQLPKPRK